MFDMEARASISESARERETFRHDPTLLSDINHNDTDPILTALAQLGVWRTGASRAFISLFGKEHQYTIAEATQTSSLRTSDRDAEEFWLRGTVIPLSSGICQQFLNTSKSEQANGYSVDLPINIIPDIRLEPRVSQSDCVFSKFPVQGYVGVPIRSQNGVDFGEYSIVTERPLQENDWTESHSRLLREISESVLDHLLSKTSQDAHSRAEKMNSGIRSFIQRKSTSLDVQEVQNNGTDFEQFLTNATDSTDKLSCRSEKISPKTLRPTPHSGSISDNLSLLSSTSDHDYAPENFQDGSDLNGSHSNWFQSVNSHETTTPSRRDSTPIEEDPLMAVFSRAANIIRESIDADGVVFYDANDGRYISENQKAGGSDISEFTSSSEEDSEAETTNGGGANDPHVIAFSTTQASSINGGTYPSGGRKMSFKTMSALLKRHQKGVIFDLDENGMEYSDDHKDEKSHHRPRIINTPPKLLKRRTTSFLGNLGIELSKSFPKARSLVFVPVWDHISRRWRAGCFAYTNEKTRFFTTNGDVTYLRAFATLAMAEIFRQETYLDRRALSGVLKSLSHELRSPLHGVILGVEFLTETQLSVPQTNFLHIVETCGRTLSDTIDHLLYYAKVNKFIPPGDRPDSRARGLRKEMNNTLQAGMKLIMTPVLADVLVEEVTESIFAGFNFQRQSIGQLKRKRRFRNSHADVHAIRQSDISQAEEDFGISEEIDGEMSKPSKYVVIDLAIEPGCSHHYHAISGAIRRIVMNLFGNALKYTNSGSIRIALLQEPYHFSQGPHRRRKIRNSHMRWAKIVVSDTGKGISRDFQENDLFREFRKEDGNKSGLGLGLVVVKKIVSSLRGDVKIESEVGVGTTVTVWLPLPLMPESSPPTEKLKKEMADYAEQKSELKGLRICFVGFGEPLGLPCHFQGPKGKNHDRPSIWRVCEDNLAMKVVTPAEAEKSAPDIVLCEEAALHNSFVTREGLTSRPLVVVCANALSAYDLSIDPMFQESMPITEFISQPTGPLKLAKALVAALRRWEEKKDASQLTDNLMPLSRASSLSQKTKRRSVSLNPVRTMRRAESVFFENTTDTEPSASKSHHRHPGSPPLSPQSIPPPNRTPVSPQEHMPKFLLVEDNEINMKLLATIMNKLKRDFVQAEDGQIAVDKYAEKSHQFSCILMDINMPRLDGIEATRQIRAFEDANHLPRCTIIALSGQASDSVHKDALQSGIDLFLTKPVQRREITQILEERGLL